VVSMAAGEGVEVVAIHVEDPVRVEGVNDRAQLARLERGWGNNPSAPTYLLFY